MLRFSRTVEFLFLAALLLVGLFVVIRAFPGLSATFNPALAAPQPTSTPVLSEAETQAVEKAKQFLREHAAEYSLKPDLSDLQVLRVNIEFGTSVVGFRQLYRDVPVDGTGVTVIIYRDPSQPSEIRSTYNSHIILRDSTLSQSNSSLKLAAKMPSADAVSKSLAAVGNVQLSKIARAELVVYPIGARGKEPQYALAWDIYLITNPYGEWEIFVDANTGEILSKGNHFVPEPTPI